MQTYRKCAKRVKNVSERALMHLTIGHWYNPLALMDPVSHRVWTLGSAHLFTPL